MTDPVSPSPNDRGPGAPSQRAAGTWWRINHPVEAGGPAFTQSQPSPAAVAQYLRIGVTITEMRDGPFDAPLARSTAADEDRPYVDPTVLRKQARTFGVMLSTMRSNQVLESEPILQAQLTLIEKLMAQIVDYALPEGGKR